MGLADLDALVAHVNEQPRQEKVVVYSPDQIIALEERGIDPVSVWSPYGILCVEGNFGDGYCQWWYWNAGMERVTDE
jgi:hypothetical protein